MRAYKLPSIVRLSDHRANLISLALGAIGYFAVPWLKGKGLVGFLPALPDLERYAAFYHVVGAALGLVAPRMVAIAWSGINRLRPRPGARAFDTDDRQRLKNSFEVDRSTLSIAMVPSHPATADAAKNSRRLDLGDAALVVPESAQLLLRDFVGSSRRGARGGSRPSAELESNILIITGEPGAGKSVLVQELQATLSKGVEEGHHSLVPFVVLARDLTLDSLEEAGASDSPLSAFLRKYYEERLAKPAEIGLVALYNLAADQWQDIDAIVIVDGLDEIAQRSRYEEIQRKLADMILIDLRRKDKAIHRYVLSCRIDEDLELFPDAQSLALKGLSDVQRDRFCQTLISRSNLDRDASRVLEEVFRTDRASPSHVFRRNPYFLSLLLRHLRDDEDRARDQVIDFDLLMRKYLERETERSFAPAEKKHSVTVEERRALFNELETVSRLSLQYLAYCAASTNVIGALYDETELSGQLLAGFTSAIRAAMSNRASQSPWEKLNHLLLTLADDKRTSIITSSQLHELDVRYLHENDVRLLDSLGLQLQFGIGNSDELVRSSMGTIPYKSSGETTDWYKELARVFRRLAPWHPTDRYANLALLLFFRGIVAAHALRITVMNFTNDRIMLRFRHRRLAEFYAASYLYNCWDAVHDTLRFSPWLAPVLNLTCALEGPQCHALQWLVTRVGDEPWQPLYEWRSAIEAAVEASFFSHPGPTYVKTASRLTETMIRTLRTRGSRVGERAMRNPSQFERDSPDPNQEQVDPVTELVLLRALESIAGLSKTFGQGPIIEEGGQSAFSFYAESLPIEWIPPMLPAREAVEILAGRPSSLKSTAAIIWKLVQQPGAILFSYGAGEKRPAWKFVIPVALATIAGEATILGLATGAVAGLFNLMAHRLTQNAVEIREGTIAASTVIGSSFFLVRLLAWWRSPIRAAEWSSSPWTKLPRFPWQMWEMCRNGGRELYALITRAPSALKQEMSPSRRFKGRALIFGFGGVVALTSALILTGWLWPEDTVDAKLVPCPEIGKEYVRILTKYTSDDITKSMAIGEARRQLLHDLDAFATMNKQQSCGQRDEEDGRWTLSEQGVSDDIAQSNPALVATTLDPIRLEESEASQFNAKPFSPTLEPNRGFVSSLSGLYQRWELIRRIDQSKSVRRRILDARRSGRGLASDDAQLIMGPEWQSIVSKVGLPGASVTASNRALDTLDDQLKGLRTVLGKLDQRRSHGYINSAILFLGLGMFCMVAVSMRSRWRDRKWIKLINMERSVRLLCKYLQNPSYSEMVRGRVIRRIDLLGVTDQSELNAVEESVRVLFSLESSTDHGLAIQATRLAGTLGNRLRHRTMIDVPVSPPGAKEHGGTGRQNS